jgi:hypothetical protein
VKQLQDIKLSDDTADRVRRNHAEAIVELQSAPFSGGRVIGGVTLGDGVETPIAHGMGRAPRWVCHSPVRGASTSGRIEEVRRDAKLVILQATGYGAAITIDLVVL